jgi:hypothetical protein
MVRYVSRKGSQLKPPHFSALDTANIQAISVALACHGGAPSAKGTRMTKVIYQVVEHDGGWAYKVGDVFSETFPTHEAAHEAAARAAQEQRVPGTTETIEFEDEKGDWHTETDSGDDRPSSEVVDK